MKLDKAKSEAERLNKDNNLEATVVRILPAHIDPPNDDDNGWDVEVEIVAEMHIPTWGDLG